MTTPTAVLRTDAPAGPTFTAAFVAGAVVVTFSGTVLDTAALRLAANYSITPPGGSPAVAVTSVAFNGTNQVTLAISGDVRGGGSYSVGLAAGTARDASSGAGNSAGSASFTVTATALSVLSATPLGATKLRVVYSKPVKQVSAGNANDALHAANYAITAFGGLAVVSVASVQPDTVDVTTATDIPGALYTLTVSNVQDLAGNTI